jgi:hypothetical protein
MRVLLAALCLLLVTCCTAQLDSAPQHLLKPTRPPVKEGIVRPSDFVTAWRQRQVPEYINPCLAISISYSK